jgi:prevent-host-death family protein
MRGPQRQSSQPISLIWPFLVISSLPIEGLTGLVNQVILVLMTTASITQAKTNLSKLIKKVRHGESVLILDRNTPVARLEPLAAGSREGDEAKLAELERRGLLKRGAGKLPRDFFKLPRLKFKKSLVEAVLEERREPRW